MSSKRKEKGNNKHLGAYAANRSQKENTLNRLLTAFKALLTTHKAPTKTQLSRASQMSPKTVAKYWEEVIKRSKLV